MSAGPRRLGRTGRDPRMRKPTTMILVIALLATGLMLTACGDDEADDADATASSLPQGSEPVDLDPAEFTSEIDNPYWPMAPGSRWVYREIDTEGTAQKVVVEVTGETRRIANGIDAAVVRDTVTENGEPIEVTDDWYAQDSEGNVWYMGEDTAEYENGEVVTRAGSFEAGVDGAQPGIIMPANPEPGIEYRQEYYEGEAEDRAAIITVGEEQVEVPAGHYTDVVMTRDVVPLEPRVEELKFYARGVGPVMAAAISGGAPGFEELVSYRPGE
jgi:hypothetical protein